MPDAPVPEERRDAVLREVDELVGQDDVGRLVGLLHRAAGGGREEPRAAELPETPDVRAVVDLGGEEMVLPSVPGEEGDGDGRKIS